MKRQLLLTAILCPLSWSAPTTMTQAVKGPDGNPGNGTVSVRVSAACTSGTDYVGEYTVNTTFLAGAFSLTLVPSDSCVPAGTSYTVGWHVCSASVGATLANPCPSGRGTSWNETWLVTTSSSPVNVSSVIVGTAPIPAYPFLLLAQLNPAGAASGNAICFNGTIYAPCAGAIGPTGAAGSNGSNGATGTQGVAGPTGAAGRQRRHRRAGAPGGGGAAGGAGGDR